MPQTISHHKFEPGTTGWTIEDLEDPEVLLRWSEGRYEIVEGVLTTMAPQGIDGIHPLSRLRRQIERQLDARGQEGEFYAESDLLLRPDRVLRPDMLFLTGDQFREQRRISRERGRADGRYNPVYVTPVLVMESVSIGHERHDRVTKRAWYAEAGVPHYWLLTEHERSLVCLVLDQNRYTEEAVGHASQTIATRAFGGLTIDLATIWGD